MFDVTEPMYSGRFLQ